MQDDYFERDMALFNAARAAQLAVKIVDASESQGAANYTNQAAAGTLDGQQKPNPLEMNAARLYQAARELAARGQLRSCLASRACRRRSSSARRYWRVGSVR